MKRIDVNNIACHSTSMDVGCEPTCTVHGSLNTFWADESLVILTTVHTVFGFDVYDLGQLVERNIAGMGSL